VPAAAAPAARAAAGPPDVRPIARKTSGCMATPSRGAGVGRGAASTKLTAAMAAETGAAEPAIAAGSNPAAGPPPPPTADGCAADPPPPPAADGCAADPPPPPAADDGAADAPPLTAADGGAADPLPRRPRSEGGGGAPDPPTQASGDGGIGAGANPPPSAAGDGGVARAAVAAGTGGVARAGPAGVLSTAARRSATVPVPIINSVTRSVGTLCVRRRMPSTTGRSGPLATWERRVRADSAVGRRGADADGVAGRRAARVTAAGDDSPDGPAGAPRAGGPTRREGPDQTAGRGAIVAAPVAPAAEPAAAAELAMNAAVATGVQRPTLAALDDGSPAAAGRLPLPTVAGGVAHVGESGAYDSLSDSPAPPPNDASVAAASRAVGRASIGDVSMSSSTVLLRAARAARRSSSFCARSAGVGGSIF